MIYYDPDLACYVDDEYPMWTWEIPPEINLDFSKTFSDKFTFMQWYYNEIRK